MKEDYTLTTRWLFIGAEQYLNSKWQPTGNYVKNMIWEFNPNYCSRNEIVGTIIESSPVDFPIEMNYIILCIKFANLNNIE